jgi:hypothetical protein
MAVFLHGAGATRGASFVRLTDNPCLPPLDTDFYAQLQRIQNKKHKEMIESVIQDTVDLFGVNFNALVAPFKQTLVGSRAYFIIESRLEALLPVGAGKARRKVWGD